MELPGPLHRLGKRNVICISSFCDPKCLSLLLWYLHSGAPQLFPASSQFTVFSHHSYSVLRHPPAPRFQQSHSVASLRSALLPPRFRGHLPGSVF